GGEATFGRVACRLRKPDGVGVLVRSGRDLGRSAKSSGARGQEGAGFDRRPLPRAWHSRSLRAEATAMTTRKSGRRRRNSISGAFAPRLIEMLEAPAYRVLSVSAHRALSRIEIEHAHHGGADNGKLPITFDQFEEYGMDR